MKGSRVRFRDVGGAKIFQAVNCFARYEIRPTGAVKRATRESSRYSPVDFRKVERLGPPYATFIIELLGSLPSNLQIEAAKF